jgi:hypothetical protein
LMKNPIGLRSGSPDSKLAARDHGSCAVKHENVEVF